ncbi:hypothetical protein GV64_09770 [Endozoicomonas elysicola]|uniref:Uncharacterized protein n=1 Tax=Endozoicomonas elysicola TaxID=305900 RepID=A0A081KA17_9GAMM|nr:hypothetical protein GV64_09770 [Endozoicomonas elysicola]
MESLEDYLKTRGHKDLPYDDALVLLAHYLVEPLWIDSVFHPTPGLLYQPALAAPSLPHSLDQVLSIYFLET